MVTGYLVFSPALARVQGSMLRGKGRILDLSKVTKTVSAILDEHRSCHTTRDTTGVERDVFLYLLINTELPWEKEILENDNFSSLAGTCLQINTLQFIELVNKLSLWQYMFECAACLPESVLSILLPTIVKVIKGEDNHDQLVGHWTAVGRLAAFLPDNMQIIKEYLSVVLKPGAENEAKVLNFISLLAVLSSHLSANSSTISESPPSSLIYNFKPAPDSSLSPGERKPEVTSSLKALFVALKAFLLDLDFNSWFEMAEMCSSVLVKSNDLSCIWLENDIPSNLQFVAAHLMSQVESLLKDDELYTGELVKELLEVMPIYASRYSKLLELNLEERSLDQLIESIKEYIPEEKPIDWRLEAFLERIVSEHLTEALGRDDCLKILSNFLPQLCGHLELIYTTLMSNQSFQLSDPLKDFLLSLARISSIHDLRTVLSLQTGLESAWLETCQFNDQFVSALNRATTGSEEGNWEFLLLALQNREKTAVCLVEEASNNPGQVKSISEILGDLNAVCWTVVGGEGQNTFLAKLLANNIIHKREREQENVIELAILLAGKSCSLGSEIYSSVLPQVVDSYINQQSADCLVLLTFCRRLIQLPKQLDHLADIVTRRSILSFCSIINQAAFTHSSTSNNIRLECISLISKLSVLQPDCDLSLCLHPLIKSYFLPLSDQPSLRDVVQRSFVKEELVDVDLLKESSDAELLADLLVLTPKVLSQEFPILHQVLSKMAATNHDNPDVYSAELVSISVRTLLLTSNCLSQVDKEELCLQLSGLLVRVMKEKVDAAKLLPLINIIAQTIWIIQERGKELENSTNGKTEDDVVDQAADKAITVEAVIASDSLWSCLQAGIAQLLSLAPSEEHLRELLVLLCLLPGTNHKQTIFLMLNNHFKQ